MPSRRAASVHEDPDPSPRRPGSEGSLVLAHAHVEGGVRIERLAPPRVDSGEGMVEAKFTYRNEEDSPGRETWRFRLETRVDGGRVQTRKVEHGDRWGWPQSHAGYLSTRHKVGAGQHELWFRVTASYTIDGWRKDDSGSHSHDEQVVEGTVILG